MKRGWTSPESAEVGLLKIVVLQAGIRIARYCGADEPKTPVAETRSGLSQPSLLDGMAKGFDFEKLLYLPGIYDSVQLILSGSPCIVNVQTSPDIQRHQV